MFSCFTSSFDCSSILTSPLTLGIGVAGVGVVLGVSWEACDEVSPPGPGVDDGVGISALVTGGVGAGEGAVFRAGAGLVPAVGGGPCCGGAPGRTGPEPRTAASKCGSMCFIRLSCL